MKIIIDAMGGDNAPRSTVEGAILARKELGAEIILVGREDEIKPLLGDNTDGIEIVHAPDVITMEDEPSTACRAKRESSMTVALNMLKAGQGDALVSAGSTGALLTGATLMARRIKGIRRAALAPVLPAGEHGVMVLDVGGTAECKPEYLLQFAFMGSFYASKILGYNKPRVGLLCNGTEDCKGTEMTRETFALLKDAAEKGKINFIGNIEGTDVMAGNVEVVVCDGFTGNVFLKTLEGTVKFIMKNLKEIMTSSKKNSMAALVLKKDLGGLKAKLDVNEVGGTALMGLSKPVIKAHGSSNATAIRSAVRQAMEFTSAGIIGLIEENIEDMKLSSAQSEE
ncbi:MAG: phosphate acyltransferase PlsX [Oscillospiraceae bacterium]|nr:phosphate acyltransferase PlsX [Oscillospiraceae bacterium]